MSETNSLLTFRAAAERVLLNAGTPLTGAEITKRALDAGVVRTTGKMPAATKEALLAIYIQQLGGRRPFAWVAQRVGGALLGSEPSTPHHQAPRGISRRVSHHLSCLAPIGESRGGALPVRVAKTARREDRPLVTS